MRNGSDQLTRLEIEILQLAASGLSTKLIARQLGKAPSTISNHLGTIYLKLGASNRAHAVALCDQVDPRGVHSAESTSEFRSIKFRAGR
jgi:DNA-binding CsgD family transcriptional regulator